MSKTKKSSKKKTSKKSSLKDKKVSKKKVTTHKDKSKSKKKIVKKKRVSLCQAVWNMFDDKGVDEVTYDDCKAFAINIKPDTKFNKSHFSWYKNKYREQVEEGIR